MKRCSTSLIREIQTISFMRDHFTLRWLEFENQTVDMEKWKPSYTVGEMETSYTVPSLWKTMWQFLQKVNLNLPCDPASPLLSIHTQEKWKLHPHKNLHTNAHSSTTPEIQNVEAHPSTDEEIKTWWHINYSSEYYRANERNVVLIRASAWLSLADMRQVTEASHKDLLFESIHLRCPEEGNL